MNLTDLVHRGLGESITEEDLVRTVLNGMGSMTMTSGQKFVGYQTS
jgi:hypothetical protein